MKKILLSIFVLFALCGMAHATAFTSTTTGNWNVGATWGNSGNNVEGSGYPGNGDTANIANGTNVTVNVTVPSSGSVTQVAVATGGDLIIHGNLTATTLKSIGTIDWLNDCGGNYTITAPTIAIGTNGVFNIGTSGTPMSAYVATISTGNFSFYSNNNDDMTINFYGASKTYWYDTTSGAIAVNDKSFTTTNSTGWAIGDHVLVPATGTTQNQTEDVVITGISGTTIYIDSNGNGTGATPKFANAHTSGIEVFNIQRNIVLTATGSWGQIPANNDLINGQINLSWVSLDKFRMTAGGTRGTNVFYSVWKNKPSENSTYMNFGNLSYVSFNYNIFYNFNGGGNYGNATLFTNGAGAKAGTSSSTFDLRFSKVFTGNAFIKCSAPFGSSSAGGFIWKDSWIYDVSTFFGNWDGDEGTNGVFCLINPKIRTVSNFIYNTQIKGFQGFYIFGGSFTNSISEFTSTNWTGSKVYIYGTAFNTLPTFTTTGPGTRWSAQDYKGVAGRYFTRFPYGEVSDQVTGGQAGSWANGGSGQAIYINPLSTTAGNITNVEFYVPVTAATNPQIKFYVKTTQTSSGPTLNVDVYDTDNRTLLVNNASVTLTGASAWTQYSVASISPSATGFIKVVLKVLNGASTGDVGVDDISFVSGGTTYTDSCDRSADGLPMIFGTGAGGGGAADTTHASGMAF